MVETETNGSKVDPKPNTKKLIRIRRGHKGVLTKVEPNVDLMLLRSIVNEEQLCEAKLL